MFDGRTVFKKLGNAGLLGITKPTQYGGLGLDYSYNLVFHEEMGYRSTAGGPVAGISVQTDMSVPALIRFGSDELKKEYLPPTIAGDLISCVGVSEPEGGSDVAGMHFIVHHSHVLFDTLLFRIA